MCGKKSALRYLGGPRGCLFTLTVELMQSSRKHRFLQKPVSGMLTAFKCFISHQDSLVLSRHILSTLCRALSQEKP